MKPLCGNLSRILVGNPLGGSYANGVYTGMWEQGDINIATGEETSSGTGVRSGYLDARENAYYTQRTIGQGIFDKISWYFYTSEKEFLGVKADTTWIALELVPVNCAYIRIVISNEATPISPADVPDIVLEDRSIWGWELSGNIYIFSQVFPIEKSNMSATYMGDLKKPRLNVYDQDVDQQKTLSLPLENTPIDEMYVKYRLCINTEENPDITPADMVNHGTWTVTFSDPVSDVWKSDGSVYYTPHNSEIQKGKILAITPPKSFKAVSLVVQDATGQNSHDITGGAEVTLSESTEWVYLTVGVSENPGVDLTNIDSYREQWSYSYKDIPAPTEPHWEGENFVFSVSDIQMEKAWQKSGNDIILVDDAGSVALPMISNPSAMWRILVNNNLGVTMSGTQLRKTSTGVTEQESVIYTGNSLSIILGEEGAQVAFYGGNAVGASAEDIYRGITITGSEG